MLTWSSQAHLPRDLRQRPVLALLSALGCLWIIKNRAITLFRVIWVAVALVWYLHTASSTPTSAVTSTSD